MKKNVLITGASGGIGQAISLKFANAGYNLILLYHNNESAIYDLIHKFPDSCKCLSLRCDLSKYDEIYQVVNKIHKLSGEVSILVNNAGIALPQTLFADTTDEQMNVVFETNVYSQIRLTRLLLDDIRNNQGSIINISSIWGLTGASCEVLYSASKSAIIGFTKALAKEMGPSQVKVNCIAPGFIDTKMNSSISFDDKESFRLMTPLEKIGTPYDIADAVYFLSQSEFITGQVLTVDGGFYC